MVQILKRYNSVAVINDDNIIEVVEEDEKVFFFLFLFVVLGCNFVLYFQDDTSSKKPEEEQLEFPEVVPVVYDSYEQYSSLLRVCVMGLCGVRLEVLH